MRLVIQEMRLERHSVATNLLRSSRHLLRERHSVLVTITDRHGLVGRGEATPLEGFGSDSIGSALSCLHENSVNCAGLELDGLIEEQVRQLTAPFSASPSARAAVDFALWDLIGLKRSLPSAQLLGELPSNDEPVCISALIDSEVDDPCDVDALIAVARRLIAAGYRTLKWKIGRTDRLADESIAVRELRRRIAPEIALRLDANSAFSLSDSAALLRAFSPARPELIEEPFSPEEMQQFVRTPNLLRDWRQADMQFALDESLLLPHAELRNRWIEAAAAAGAMAVVIKPMALGGIATALECARFAASLGLRVITTHLWDGPWGLAAAIAVARALPARQVLSCGVAPHAGLSEWSDWTICGAKGAHIVRDRTSGLGVVRVNANV